MVNRTDVSDCRKRRACAPRSYRGLQPPQQRIPITTGALSASVCGPGAPLSVLVSMVLRGSFPDVGNRLGEFLLVRQIALPRNHDALCLRAACAMEALSAVADSGGA